MADAVKLHGFWRSLGTYRVRIALAIKGIEFEEQSVNLLKGEQFTDAISSINPQCTLPIMWHEGSSFTQSLAIIEYLEEMYPTPPLLPENPKLRAAVRSFALITIADAHPLTVPRARNRLAEQFNASESDVEQWAHHWSQLALASMETVLAKREQSSRFCFTDEPGLADIALASQVAGGKFFDVSLDEFPTIRSTMALLNERDEFVATAPAAIKAKTE